MSNKICTSIEQSKKLLSLGLDPSTSDMWYSYYGNSKYNPTIAYEGQQWFLCQIRNSLHNDIPCWSLAALLELMPPYLFEWERGIDLNIYRNINGKGWHVSYIPNNIIDMQKDKFRQITNGNSPIDAAFEMVCWLIEQGHIKVNK